MKSEEKFRYAFDVHIVESNASAASAELRATMGNDEETKL